MVNNSHNLWLQILSCVLMYVVEALLQKENVGQMANSGVDEEHGVLSYLIHVCLSNLYDVNATTLSKDILHSLVYITN